MIFPSIRTTESNQPTILVLLDFSKAFDSVRQRYGFQATAAAVVSSYPFSRYQKNTCGDDVSPLAPLVTGVPQRSPISPLCFSLYIDDMTEVLEFSKYHMHADNLQINHSRPREMLFECICEVNSDLSKVFEWSLANYLKLNPAKSIPIYRNHLLGPFPALFLGEDFIPYVFKAKNLGVTFSYSLNWSDHVMRLPLGLGDWQMSPLSPFVCDLLLHL
jgi:hypothetical protein